MKYLLLSFMFLACTAQAQSITELDENIRFVGYELNLREPLVYQANITYVNDKGKLDSVTVRENWRYHFLAKVGDQVGFGVKLTPVNPKTIAKGVADLVILEDQEVTTMGVGYKFKLTYEVGTVIQVPKKEPIKSN